MSTMTPYAAAKSANTILETQGLKAIPPQMVYTYVNKGYIKSTVVDGKARVTQEDLLEWLEKYVAKKTTKTNTTTEVEHDTDGTIGEW